jgi:hypothetical protein
MFTLPLAMFSVVQYLAIQVLLKQLTKLFVHYLLFLLQFSVNFVFLNYSPGVLQI